MESDPDFHVRMARALTRWPWRAPALSHENYTQLNTFDRTAYHRLGTPLSVACELLHCEAVTYFLEHKADPNVLVPVDAAEWERPTAANRHEWFSPLDIAFVALVKSLADGPDIDQYAQVAQTLLEFGARPEMSPDLERLFKNATVQALVAKVVQAHEPLQRHFARIDWRQPQPVH